MSFKIKGDYIEMIKLLKVTGLCESGGMAKTVVDEGLVKVNGRTEFRKRHKLRKGQIIEFEGSKVVLE